MYSEEDLLMLSGLQHVLFCERQWALIHLEGLWVENRLTAQGRLLHEKVHERKSGRQGDVILSRSLSLRSLRLGVSGKADMVEFHLMKEHIPGESAVLPGRKGFWRPFPVEYKRGRPKSGPYDQVQLCAQAICLEEMLEVNVPSGALFYGQNRRRKEVVFNTEIRGLTETTAERMHDMHRRGITPQARYEKQCRSCSFYDLCQPKTIIASHSAKRYLKKILMEEWEGEGL